MLIRKIRGQSTIEYALLVVVILAAFIATSSYVKRGLQGRWKDAVDGMGDQYDPRLSNTDITYTTSGSGASYIRTINALPVNGVNGNGIWTIRLDSSSTSESKSGNVAVGAY